MFLCVTVAGVKKITYSAAAQKQIWALDMPLRVRIVTKVEHYAANPIAHANQVKRLQGSNRLRLRVGDYRVIFTEDMVVLTVIAVGHRRDIYRHR
ncbi:MAG: hypothetical protein DCC73_06395 [Proteobacteria bacterium]|nr:MAG: hypothetical protein DCC73_06395 [Pseudomonadota bacterium]